MKVEKEYAPAKEDDIPGEVTETHFQEIKDYPAEDTSNQLTTAVDDDSRWSDDGDQSYQLGEY